MKSITINIKDDSVVDKVTWMLNHFVDDGVEIISKEDLDDLVLLKSTQGEDSISLDEYFNNESPNS